VCGRDTPLDEFGGTSSWCGGCGTEWVSGRQTSLSPLCPLSYLIPLHLIMVASVLLVREGQCDFEPLAASCARNPPRLLRSLFKDQGCALVSAHLSVAALNDRTSQQANEERERERDRDRLYSFRFSHSLVQLLPSQTVHNPSINL
jgi:hypothetical protein